MKKRSVSLILVVVLVLAWTQYSPMLLGIATGSQLNNCALHILLLNCPTTSFGLKMFIPGCKSWGLCAHFCPTR